MTIYGFHSTGILLMFFATALILWVIMTIMFGDPLGMILFMIGAIIIILTVIFRDKVRLDKL